MPTRRNYKHKRVNGKHVGEHRHVWAEAHGPIPDGCVIHHKDNDPTNNELDNLELMTHQQHAAHHNTRHPKTKECAHCGETFTPHPTKRKRAVTCSRACFKAHLSTLTIKRYAINDERNERIQQLADMGVPKKQIAAIYNLSPASITRITKDCTA